MTPIFNLPHIAGDQAQKHVTHNAALDGVDALLPGLAVSASAAAAPASPAEGEVHIVATGATGFGTAAAGDLAIFYGGVWQAVTPPFGARLLVLDEGAARVYAGSAGWARGDIVSPLGAAAGLRVVDTVLDLSTTTTATALIPDRAVVFGVTSWTIAEVTGATAYRVGDGTSDNRFGASLGAAAGSSNRGVVGPFAVYSDTDITVTAEGGSFTGGQVGLAAIFLDPATAPV